MSTDLVAAVAARTRLVDLTIEEPQIENIVRRIYEGDSDVSCAEEGQCSKDSTA